MQICSDTGYLTLKGVPYMADGVEVVYLGEVKGHNVAHHLFRARGGWLITVTDIDLELGDAIFSACPVKVKARMKYHAA